MPDIEASIDYLQDLPLYKTEKPYYCLLAPHEGFDPNAQRLDNLEYEAYPNIKISDMRPSLSDFKMEEYGFQVVPHQSAAISLATVDEIQAYRKETEELLRKQFGAVFVKTYEVRKRENIAFSRAEIDYNDPLLIEGPAKGAHNDVTYSSGPVIINRHLSEEDKSQFLKPGHRFRIMNTWRPLLPAIEDRPLALCDSRSVEREDLIPADRILPDRVGEVYYLTYNPNHRWYWLEKQTPAEPFVFVMYDTKNGYHARFCPHVSFDNVRKPSDAPARRSVETRSVVITKE